MRKVKKDFDAPPAILLSQACLNLIALSLTEQEKHDFKSGTYGHPEVRAVLDIIYQSKCAFCETDTSAGATLQVEHYRPKAKITATEKPKGYFWLGYQWTNLLLACSSCNNRKRNHFPVSAARVEAYPQNLDESLDTQRCRVDAPELVAEQPLLVNPEVDPDPMQHFRFQADGTIGHKTTMGQKTIETCNLNRGRLVVWRKKFYDEIFGKFMKNFDRFKNGHLNEDQLKTRLQGIIEDDLVDYINKDSSQYLEFAKTCWREFDAFFLKRFQPPERKHLKAVYDDFLATMAGLP